MKFANVSCKAIVILLVTIAVVCFFSQTSLGRWIPPSLRTSPASQTPLQGQGGATPQLTTYLETISPMQREQERKYLEKIPVQDENVRKGLEAAINYKLKVGEYFDNTGNPVFELTPGKKITLLGYKEQKWIYEFFKKYRRPKPNIGSQNVVFGGASHGAAPHAVSSGESRPQASPTAGPPSIEELPRTSPKIHPINPLFDDAKFSPYGLMYYAADLYNQGVFPFLPYLTPARYQGIRGTCTIFAITGALELISMDRPDLSEQNFWFQMRKPHQPEEAKLDIPGLEKQWPYNPKFCCEEIDTDHPDPADCVYSGYYSELIPNEWIPCKPSDLDLQGISTSDGLKSYPEYKGTETTAGRCYTFEGLPDATVNDLKYILLHSHYPVSLLIYMNTDPEHKHDIIHGFADKDLAAVMSFYYNHSVLAVGFIPKEFIPDAVKSHPNSYFRPNEDYIIIKNSWGTDYADSGFLYLPASMFGPQFNMNIYKYDLESVNFENCPDRDYNGVGPRPPFELPERKHIHPKQRERPIDSN